MKLKKKPDNCSANIISSQLQNIENCFPNCYIFVIVDGFILSAKQKDNMHAKNVPKNCEANLRHLHNLNQCNYTSSRGSKKKGQLRYFAISGDNIYIYR